MGYGYYTESIDGVERHCGYGVQCVCDHPGCDKRIHRGLAYLCGQDPGEGSYGCGRYFCEEHLGYRTYGRGKDAETVRNCSRCQRGRAPFPMKPDIPEALEYIVFDSDPEPAEDATSETPS